jgi:phage tail-like protein
MAGFSEFDSAGTHKFSFELDGIATNTIKSVDGLTLKLEKVETKSNNAAGMPVHKVWAGNRVFLGQMSVTRVQTDDPSWEHWYNEAVRSVPGARKSGIVSIMNQEGHRIREYIFKHAWPVELKITNMNASSSAPIEETVTFVYESLECKPI